MMASCLQVGLIVNKKITFCDVPTHVHRQLDFELGPLNLLKKVQIAQLSLNIIAPITRKDTNPSHPLTL